MDQNKKTLTKQKAQSSREAITPAETYKFSWIDNLSNYEMTQKNNLSIFSIPLDIKGNSFNGEVKIEQKNLTESEIQENQVVQGKNETNCGDANSNSPKKQRKERVKQPQQQRSQLVCIICKQQGISPLPQYRDMNINTQQQQQQSQKLLMFSATKYLEEKEKYLMFPCLCQYLIHRRCMKNMIVSQKVMDCKQCKAEFAVSPIHKRVSLKKPKEFLKALLQTILYLALSLLAIYFSILFNQNNTIITQNEQNVESVKFLSCVVLAIIFFILFILSLYKKFISNHIVDFIPCCKQTELARHAEEPKLLINRVITQEEKKKKSKLIQEANIQIQEYNNNINNIFKETRDIKDEIDQSLNEYYNQSSRNYQQHNVPGGGGGGTNNNNNNNNQDYDEDTDSFNICQSDLRSGDFLVHSDDAIHKKNEILQKFSIGKQHLQNHVLINDLKKVGVTTFHKIKIDNNNNNNNNTVNIHINNYNKISHTTTKKKQPQSEIRLSAQTRELNYKELNFLTPEPNRKILEDIKFDASRQYSNQSQQNIDEFSQHEK